MIIEEMDANRKKIFNLEKSIKLFEKWIKVLTWLVITSQIFGCYRKL